jgi:hypothetical protein
MPTEKSEETASWSVKVAQVKHLSSIVVWSIVRSANVPKKHSYRYTDYLYDHVSSGLSDFGWYGVTGASLSVMLAGVKEFEGPVAAVRIASDEAGNFIFDPTFEQLSTAHLDLTVAGTLDAITMVESQWTKYPMSSW